VGDVHWLEPIASGRLVGAVAERGTLLGQRRVLELIALGRPLNEVLDTLCRVIEDGIAGTACSVLLLDRAGKHLHHAAAPHLPRAYCEAINGAPIGPAAGSCGTAAYRQSTVIVTDIASDPLWSNYKALAATHGLAACASVPISTGEGAPVLGTFAIYHARPGPFASAEIELLRAMTDLAAIAIVHDQRAQVLERLQRATSLGVLAGGIAHDINNLLTAISANVELAVLKTSKEDPAAANLHAIESAVQQGNELTRMLLSYARDVPVPLVDVDLNTLLTELLRTVASSVPTRVAIACDLDSTLPLVRANSAQIQQLALNLITNAVEAIGQAPGKIEVHTYVAQISAAQATTRVTEPALSAGSYAVLEVSDTGCGMSRETMGRVFEPFFSTKASGHGLGLSSLLGVVKAHHGGVEVESEIGRGATFRLFLPFAEVAAKPPAPREPTPSETRPKKQVLLVEDDASVRGVVAHMLKHLGYAAIQAGNGQEALDALEQHQGHIDVVLMDVKMPRMDARAALPHMERRWPHVPVILSSGDDDEVDLHREPPRNVVGFLPKPYRAQELRDVMASALGPASERARTQLL